MTLDINKAYKYYVNNIEKSCDKTPLDENSFRAAFTEWIANVQQQEIMATMQGIEHIPILTKCGNGVFLQIKEILKKINNI
jgi:hypothetical protein